MKLKLKHIIIVLILSSFTSIIYGFSVKEEDLDVGQKYIGVGTIGLFLIAMPLFLFKESRGKNMKDYMLTKDNIKKMQDNERKKTGNQ